MSTDLERVLDREPAGKTATKKRAASAR